MKKIILMSLLGLMVGSTACEDNKDEFLSDYATTMYFRNSGEQQVTCYITGEDTKYNLSVVKAGNDEKALSDAEVSVMDAAQLAVYNSENGTDYIMLPSNCYEFNTETNLKFDANDAYKLVGLNLKPSNVKALGEGNYVLPLVLTSSKQVNEEKNVVFVKPTAVLPKLSMAVNADKPYTLKGGGTISIPLKLQIDNQWDFQAKVTIDQVSTTMTGISLANDGVVDFTAGNNGILEINVPTMNTIQGTIALKIEEVIGKEFEFESSVQPVNVRIEAYPLKPEMLSSNAVEPSEGSLANLLDNNINTHFHSAFSVAVSGVHYVQVNLPEGIKKFGFLYANRAANANAAVYALKLYAGNDSNNLTEIQTFAWDAQSNPLPWDKAGAEWLSHTIELSESCNILRFDATGTFKGYFVWSEFKLFVLE